MPSFSAELVDWLQPGGIGAGLAIVWTETRAQGKRIDELRDDMKELRAEHKAATTMVPWPHSRRSHRRRRTRRISEKIDDKSCPPTKNLENLRSPLGRIRTSLPRQGFSPCHGKAFHKGAALGRWGAGLSLRDRSSLTAHGRKHDAMDAGPGANARQAAVISRSPDGSLPPQSTATNLRLPWLNTGQHPQPSGAAGSSYGPCSTRTTSGTTNGPMDNTGRGIRTIPPTHHPPRT